MATSLKTSGGSTFAVGRFLIDLPEHFRLQPNSYIDWTVGESADFYKIEAKLIRTAGNTPSFEAMVTTAINTHRAAHHRRSADNSRFISSRRTADSLSAPVVVRSYTNAGLIDALTCEVFVECGPNVVVLTRQIFASGPRISPEVVESQLVDLAMRMRAIDAVTEKGPGLGLGSLLVDAAFDGESITASFRSSLWPEVRVTAFTRSLLNELDGGLLKRIDAQSSALASMGFSSKVLRRGATTLGGVPAEELLESGNERDKTVRSFMAEALLKQPATKARPQLTLSLKMGGQVNSEYVEPQLSETDSLALWDHIRNSVRPRPGAI